MPDRHDGMKVGREHDCVRGATARPEKRKMAECFQPVGCGVLRKFQKSENSLESPADFAWHRVASEGCQPRKLKAAYHTHGIVYRLSRFETGVANVDAKGAQRLLKAIQANLDLLGDDEAAN